MKCEMIDVTPGEHGEGVEIPCDGEAVALVEGCPACKRHSDDAAAPGTFGVLAVLPLGSTDADFAVEIARLRALGLY